jgi:tRNA(Ile)-lysidine synthetase-like protein
MDWIRTVTTFLETCVSPNNRLLLAVSGGADSMGMLALLHERLGLSADHMMIGHVQHGIRACESDDLAVIRDYAGRSSLEVVSRKVNAPELAAASKMSLEAAARRLRYEALEEMANESRCQSILTAHTLDDNAETVWMRMQNGGSWYEWTGIPARRGRVLRPLLDASREELRQWVVKQGVLFREDETNSDRHYQRNRVRDEMASRPDIWNTQRKQELAQLGEMAGRAMESSRRLARVLPLRISDTQKPRVIGLAIDAIFIYFKGLKFVPVEAAWADLHGATDARLPSSVRRQVSEFVGGRGPEAELPLPGGVRLIRRGAILWLTLEPIQHVDRPVHVGTICVPEASGTIEISFCGYGGSAKLSPDVWNRPVRLRTWRYGDRLKAPGRPVKRISDLLNEAALNPVVRENTLVLADDHGPLMILGGPIDERALPGPLERKPVTVTWTVND